MSKFYPNDEENEMKRVNRIRLQQCRMITTGKHDGSKSKKRILCNIHRGMDMTRERYSFMQKYMSGYKA